MGLDKVCIKCTPPINPPINYSTLFPSSDLPETWRDIHEVATAGQITIFNATGTEYEVGSSTNVIYPAAGGSDDYALGVCNIPIAITMELPGEDFVLPEDLLQEKVEESWLGIHEMALTAIAKYV